MAVRDVSFTMEQREFLKPSIKSMLDKVKDFHDKFGIHRPSEPSVPSAQVIENRMRKTREEVKEMMDEFQIVRCYPESKDALAHLAQELADVLYMTLGNALTFGIDIEKVFDEVHKANMSKSLDINERIVKTEPGYQPADIGSILYGTD